MKQILLKKSFFIFLIVLLFSLTGFSQTTGDYQSSGTGAWTSLASWERWDGTSWVTPTVGQGWPGQNAGTGAVLIQSGHIISVLDTGISTESMGTLTVSGKIILNGKTNATIDFSFNTQTVIVTPYTGEINFQRKISFILPSTATLQVVRDTSVTPEYKGLSGDCSHNQDIYIGTNVYAYCNGGGSTGLTFQEVMDGGGTINAEPSSNSPVCQGNTVDLLGSYTGVTGTAVSYSWLITDPNGGTTTTNTQNPTISNPIVGTYTAKLTCSTTYNSSTYSNSETILIIVDSSPTVATIGGGSSTICVNSATPAFTNTTSGGIWSIINGTGTASITTGGVVTGLTTGSVTVIYTVSNGTCSNSVTKSLIVNSLPTQPTLSTVTHPTCSEANGRFTITNYNASYTYSATPSTEVVISGSTVTAPEGSYTITASLGTCPPVASSSVTVNAQPLTPSPPTAGTPTNPNCIVPTGSVPLSGLPTSGTIIQTGYRDEIYAITSGGTQTITGLLPGTYYFAVSNGSCTSTTVSVVIIAPDTNTWSNGSWSNGTPTINQRLVFASNYPNTNDVDIEGCSCQVTGSTAVTIKSGRTLKIENGVEVQTNATLTFENDASLVQINDDAVNSGNIRYHRHTDYVKRYDFTYWSSPVAGQTLKALSPNTLYDKYYSYNPNTGWVISYNGAAIMEEGKGYIIRAPQTFSITVPAIDTDPVFIGPPNNGVVTLASLAGNKVHLLGNPYPSAMDADKFIAANSTSLEGTLYFWTHNTSPSKDIAGNAIYNYTTNDYVTYNKTGGINSATGKIAAGQSFFAPASATGGTVVFNNNMRLGAGEVLLDNSQFFRLSNTSKATAKTTVAEKSRVWLNLTNKEGAFKQSLVGYISGATNDYDGGFDGMTYDGNQFVDFYSVNNNVNLAIQGRALPFVKQDSVVLGYKSTIVGEFQISIDHTDGALSSQNIFLEDKDLQVLHDLKKAPYTFSTEKGTFKNRFVLRYIDKNAVEEVIVPEISGEVLNKDVLVSVQDGKITINSTDALLNQVIVYDITGRIVYQENEITNNVFVIPHLIPSQQLLLVDVLLSNGTKFSKKIIH